MTSVWTTNSTLSLQATLKASTARAADGDDKANTTATSSGPAGRTACATLAALAMQTG